MIDIFFDMDDTLCNTRSWMEKFASILGYTKFTPDLYHIERQDVPPHIIEFALSEARFMLDAEPIDIMIPTLHLLKCRGHALHICTHRGYHDKGIEYTDRWLTDRLVREFFTDIHCIDGKEHPCKLKYLDTVSSNYKLVDDNAPNLVGENGSVVLFTRPWNAKRNGPRISSISQLLNI